LLAAVLAARAGGRRDIGSRAASRAAGCGVHRV